MSEQAFPMSGQQLQSPETQFLLRKSLSGQPINLSRHPIRIMPQNMFLVGPGLGFDALLYIHPYRLGEVQIFTPKGSLEAVLREIICGEC
jgi:hypothetical protein